MNTSVIFRTDAELLREGTCKLLKIKDSDIRLLILLQGDTAVDRGIHSGGAMSAVLPLTALYYGGYINYDLDDPSKFGQDMFVLSKGHAVAAMASVYYDIGLFKSELLENSRSYESILNGHPGPLLPGVHIATGPLGQGLAAAQGFAMAGKADPNFNVFAVTGDGELQEGVVWEAIMHSPQARLDNLCMLVDKNEGQLDIHTKLIFPMDNLPAQIESFGWRVFDVDGTSYSSVCNALDAFCSLPRDGRPTAIICNSKKGFGSFTSGLNKHKITLGEEEYRIEKQLQEAQRTERMNDLLRFIKALKTAGKVKTVEELTQRARVMNLDISKASISEITVVPWSGKVPPRDKEIVFNTEALPAYAADEQVAASDVIKDCMKEFAKDPRVVSIDSDLGSTSGLEAGIGAVDQGRGINIGIAESNMMCVGEAYAALGYNAWVSTFCPFFDWKVLRRIAVGQQEREEAINSPDGWLSEGHLLDLTFLATAPNFETKTNGATHMGNDDTVVFGGIGGLKIIDVSCPNQQVSIMKWLMKGNKGLNYVRIMRAASGVIYPAGIEFEFGKAYQPFGDGFGAVNFISSGRGIHEAIAAGKILAGKGIEASVYDMPSFDEKTIVDVLSSDGITIIAEQNNGFIYEQLGRLILRTGETKLLKNCRAVNANDADGRFHYIHSATYSQLLDAYGLTPEKLASAAEQELKNR